VKGEPPAWTLQPTRTVDSGYVVYVGRGEDAASERAAFKAEGQALGDLANECSFAPKGTRVEDRFETRVEDRTQAWTKIAVTFEECEGARMASDPDAIRRLANPSMTQQIVDYQKLLAHSPEANATASSEPSGYVEYHPEGEATPVIPPIADRETWILAREQIAEAKQAVILSTPEEYAPGSEERDRFERDLMPARERIVTYEKTDPQVRDSRETWSRLPAQPRTLPALALPYFRPPPAPPTPVPIATAPKPARPHHAPRRPASTKPHRRRRVNQAP
jgi:hypothetical protein